MKCKECSNDAKPCGACKLHCGASARSFHKSNKPLQPANQLTSQKSTQPIHQSTTKQSKSNQPDSPSKGESSAPELQENTGVVKVIYAEPSDIHEIRHPLDGKIFARDVYRLAREQTNIPKGESVLFPNQPEWKLQNFIDHGRAPPIVLVSASDRSEKFEKLQKSYNELLVGMELVGEIEVEGVEHEGGAFITIFFIENDELQQRIKLLENQPKTRQLTKSKQK